VKIWLFNRTKRRAFLLIFFLCVFPAFLSAQGMAAEIETLLASQAAGFPSTP